MLKMLFKNVNFDENGDFEDMNVLENVIFLTCEFLDEM